jgi:hypothetical protein
MTSEEMRRAGFREIAGMYLLAPMSVCATEAASSSELDVLAAAEGALMTALRHVMARRAEVAYAQRKVAEVLGPEKPSAAVLADFAKNVLGLPADAQIVVVNAPAFKAKVP